MGAGLQKIGLIHSTEKEKQSQLKRLREFKARHKDESRRTLARLQQAMFDKQNVFEVLVDAVSYRRSGRSPMRCLRWGAVSPQHVVSIRVCEPHVSTAAIGLSRRCFFPGGRLPIFKMTL